MSKTLTGVGQPAKDFLDVFGVKESMVTSFTFQLEANKEAKIIVEYLVPEDITRNFKEVMTKYKLVEITDE